MLNENLMDSKDIIIAKLKLAIKEFQEYDIERKKYYSNALVELGKLKDEIEELRGINKYSKSYIAMKDENRRLKASLARKGIKELTDFYDVKNVELIIQNQTLKGENRKHGDAFRQLIITKCVPEYFNDRLFNGIFGGMF